MPIPSIEIYLSVNVADTMSTRIPIIRKGKQVTDNTCLTVSLKCENCDHQESMKMSEYESYLKWMPDTNDQKILCPFCLGYMHPVTDKDTK